MLSWYLNPACSHMMNPFQIRNHGVGLAIPETLAGKAIYEHVPNLCWHAR